ncbi:hypothetical protein DZC75_05275 [Pseudomonas parafulva]|uniref:Uncharacterized protein n=1 Tax=Pseudomonas parafulva TaxID=157782 RepID=A0AAI8K906_9PSED|nr:hypothetical protein DZC75_05275 [Pseudomonas parafulva]
MALICIFMSSMRQPAEQGLFARFSSARRALYTVPVQFRDMFRGKVGSRHGTSVPRISPGL